MAYAYQPGGLAGMSGRVFVGDHLLLDIGFAAARCQLGRAVVDGLLLGACEYAYGAGMSGLAQAAVLGAGMPRLVGVCPGDVTDSGGCARLALRWEATEPDGVLFPAVDAELTLRPAGEGTTVLALAGVYRVTGPAAAGPDLAVARWFASVTIRSFIARLACALVHPAGAGVANRAAATPGCDHGRSARTRQPESPYPLPIGAVGSRAALRRSCLDRDLGPCLGKRLIG
jgi:hypothetical protein